MLNIICLCLYQVWDFNSYYYYYSENAFKEKSVMKIMVIMDVPNSFENVHYSWWFVKDSIRINGLDDASFHTEFQSP
jgi:hypothetical protein